MQNSELQLNDFSDLWLITIKSDQILLLNKQK
jgi:hypothetical protein